MIQFFYHHSLIIFQLRTATRYRPDSSQVAFVVSAIPFAMKTCTQLHAGDWVNT
jgi:hypothetical protein